MFDWIKNTLKKVVDFLRPAVSLVVAPVELIVNKVYLPALKWFRGQLDRITPNNTFGAIVVELGGYLLLALSGNIVVNLLAKCIPASLVLGVVLIDLWSYLWACSKLSHQRAFVSTTLKRAYPKGVEVTTSKNKPCLPLLENLIRVSGAVEIKEEERFMSRRGNFSGLHSEPLDVAGYFYSEDDRWVFVEPGEESNVTYFQDYNNPEKILRHHYKSSRGYVDVASSTELEEMISSYTTEVITPSKVEIKTVNDAEYTVVDFQVASV